MCGLIVTVGQPVIACIAGGSASERYLTVESSFFSSRRARIFGSEIPTLLISLLAAHFYHRSLRQLIDRPTSTSLCSFAVATHWLRPHKEVNWGYFFRNLKTTGLYFTSGRTEIGYEGL